MAVVVVLVVVGLFRVSFSSNFTASYERLLFSFLIHIYDNFKCDFFLLRCFLPSLRSTMMEIYAMPYKIGVVIEL